MVLQIILSILSFSAAAAFLVWFIVDEIKWYKHKEEIKRKYKPGGAEEVRGCTHSYQIVGIVGFILFGLFLLP